MTGAQRTRGALSVVGALHASLCARLASYGLRYTTFFRDGDRHNVGFFNL